MGLQEAGLSGESKRKGGYLRHSVPDLKQVIQGPHDSRVKSDAEPGHHACCLCELPAPGCATSAPKTAPREPLDTELGLWLFTLGTSVCLIQCSWKAVLKIGIWGRLRILGTNPDSLKVHSLGSLFFFPAA